MIVGPGDRPGKAISYIVEGVSLTYVWLSLQSTYFRYGSWEQYSQPPGGTARVMSHDAMILSSEVQALGLYR